jgi:WS/DGAT/MGAT family acyltransferase
VYKVHHSAVDGLATLDMLNALADPSPDEPEKDASADTWRPGEVPGRLGMLWRSYLGALSEPGEMVRAVSDLVVGGARVGREILSGEHQRPDGRLTAPKTPFNASVSDNRVLGATMFSLGQIKQIRKQVPGSTVNDVILSVCAGALRRYLSEIDELPDESLVGMVPIAVRDDVADGGNRISGMTLSLETTEADPLERLRLIHEHTVDSKAYSQALGARTLTDFAEAVPFGLGVVSARLYTRLHIADYLRPLFNIILTNVPGPREKKYLGGAELQSTYGMAPVVDGLGAIMVITSYLDTLYVSIYACPDLLPDVGLFLDGLKAEYQVLLQSVDEL